MAKAIVQFKINGWMQRGGEESASAAVLNEIINRIAGAELVAVLPNQNIYQHSCSITSHEKCTYIDIVTRLPSDCLADPLQSADAIKNFVMEALDSAMLTLEQQLHCPQENFYIIEAYDGD